MLTAHAAHPDPVVGMNTFQQVLADAMADAGIPLDERGSKAALARRSGVSETIIGYIFNRTTYLPDDGHRAALAQALNIPKSRLDAAGAAIKGLRAHGSVLRGIEQVEAELVLAEDELTPEELDEAHRQLQALVRRLQRRRRQS